MARKTDFATSGACINVHIGQTKRKSRLHIYDRSIPFDINKVYTVKATGSITETNQTIDFEDAQIQPANPKRLVVSLVAKKIHRKQKAWGRDTINTGSISITLTDPAGGTTVVVPLYVSFVDDDS